MNPNNHGRTHVSVNHIPEYETAVYPQKYSNSKTDKRFEKLAGFMRVWFELTGKDRRILTQVFINWTNESELARKYGVTPQAIQQRLLSLADKYPEIRAVLKPKLKALQD